MTNEERQRFSRRLRERDAEIERLRAQLDGIIEKGMNDLTMVAAFQVNEELRAEIEHLRTTIGYLADNISDYPALVAVAEAALKPKP